MVTLRSLFERIGNAAPALRQWMESLAEDEMLDTEWSQLAHQIVDLPAEDAITAIRSIAPLIEEALETHDEQDRVSLGFVETLIWLGEEKRFDPALVRATLGPIAREQWDALSDYLHQGDWSLVHFDDQHIEGVVPARARFENWSVKRGAKVPADAAIARLMSGGISYHLVAKLACQVDRFAVQNGHELTEGDLLLYVLPDDYRQFRRQSPYVALRPVPAGAAA